MSSPYVDYKPLYSHGGADIDGWPRVMGTSTGAGRPIMTYGAIMCAAMAITCTGGGATVLVQMNNGQLDDDGNPPPGEWLTQNTYTMTAGTTEAPTLNYAFPIFRTYISAIDAGATVTSCVSHIVDRGFQVHGPKYPTQRRGATA